jgi:branched-chain amino acid aminotransferase
MTSLTTPDTSQNPNEHHQTDALKWCWLNGSIIESKKASVSIFDRGYLYGDGLFETIRVHQGNPFQWQRHWDRLKSGCEGLKMPMNISEEVLKEIILELTKKNQTNDCTARIQISRGLGPRGYLPPENSQATWSITLHPAPELSLKQPRSWNLIVSNMRMPSHWKCAQWKTTNKLFQTLIKQEARDVNADDAIILNEQNHITELSCANLFFVMGDRILTPPIESGILPGTTRALVLDILNQSGIQYQETTCDMEMLKEATTVFATLSTFGLIHIHRIHDQIFELHPMEKTIYDGYLKRLKMKF